MQDMANTVRFSRPDGSCVTITGSDMTRNEAIERDKHLNPRRWGLSTHTSDEEESMPLNYTDDPDFGREGAGHILGDDDDTCDITPLSTFNAEEYATNEAARNARLMPQGQATAPPVSNADDDEYDMVPPSTFQRR